MNRPVNFPFNTLEKAQKDSIIAQPYSTSILFFTILMLFYFLFQTKNIHVILVLVAIILFETFHMLSHAFHIPGNLQVNFVHFSAYFIFFALFSLLYSISKVFPSIYFMIFCVIIILFDIYAFFNLSLVYFATTHFILNISLLYNYQTYLPNKLKQNLPFIVFLLILTTILITLEKKYGDEFLEKYPNFPFHAINEVIGFLLFHTVAHSIIIIP